MFLEMDECMCVHEKRTHDSDAQLSTFNVSVDLVQVTTATGCAPVEHATVAWPALRGLDKLVGTVRRRVRAVGGVGAHCEFMVLSAIGGRCCQTAMHWEAVGSGPVPSSVMVMDPLGSPCEGAGPGSPGRESDLPVDRVTQLPLCERTMAVSLRPPPAEERLPRAAEERLPRAERRLVLY